MSSFRYHNKDKALKRKEKVDYWEYVFDDMLNNSDLVWYEYRGDQAGLLYSYDEPTITEDQFNDHIAEVYKEELKRPEVVARILAGKNK